VAEKEANVNAPPLGEKTLRQVAGIFSSIWDAVDVPRGRFNTYRRMRANPTVALARTVATAPVKMAAYSVEKDDETSEEIQIFIKNQIDRLWPQLIEDLMWSLDYGFQSFEKVWEVKPVDSVLRLVLGRLKALAPDQVEVRADNKFGNFVGITQDGVELNVDKCFHYVYDGEPGNYYGRSRHENIREFAWFPWTQVALKQLKYMAKIAGVIPMIKYPIGKSRDATGAETTNFEIAEAILKSLGSGKGVAMPQELAAWARDMSRQGIDPEAYAAWHISFLETKGQHGKGFVDSLRHYESLILRGWLVPERAATEGQFGTKAEASTHGSVALVTSDELHKNILRAVNQDIINPLLRFNFGEDTQDTVYLKQGGLDPVTKAFYRGIVEKVLTAPSNVDIFQTWLDVDNMLELAELPKAQENVNLVIKEDEDDEDDDNPNPGDEDKDKDEDNKPLSKKQIQTVKEIYAAFGS